MPWGNCPHCEAKLEAPTWDALAKAAQEHEKSCPRLAVPQAGPPARNITEVLPPEVLRGNLVTMEDELEKLILVTDFIFRDSTLKEDATYLSLTVEIDGETKVLNTGAERVVQAFRALQHKDLPVYVTFEKVATTAGRRVYRIKV